MASKTEKLLSDFGYTGTLIDFRADVAELKAVLCPTWSDEQLVTRPVPEDDEPLCAVLFCDTLRKRIRCPKIPNSLILRTLLNMHKYPVPAEDQ